MKIENTENGDLNHNDPLSKGIVIFPENEKDIIKIEKLMEFLKIWIREKKSF